MKTLSKIVITVVVIVVFCVVGIFINAGTNGEASWLILALAAGMIAAIRAVWKKDKPKSENDIKIKDIDVSNDKDIDLKS